MERLGFGVNLMNPWTQPCLVFSPMDANHRHPFTVMTDPSYTPVYPGYSQHDTKHELRVRQWTPQSADLLDDLLDIHATKTAALRPKTESDLVFNTL